MNTQQRDEMLWQIAKKRASFKYNALSYVLVNLFLVGIWYFSSRDYHQFWPIWPMLGWGLGLTFHYFGAYHTNHLNDVEKEYQKLKSRAEQ